ncbi:MAG: CaiB/BaiF CoA transferase family protein, partial [Candidatus Binatia bacterium]
MMAVRDVEGRGGEQALAGIRVVEFSSAMAGPWIGRFMAWAGAEVVRVESAKHPDVVRQYVPPWAPELGTQPQLSPWFTDWNAGKRFVALDLSRPRAIEIARRLVGICDLVIENYSGGVVDRLGLGYEDLRAVKPDLIMLSTSGYGRDGPCSGYVTWGPNIEALSGSSRASGFPHRECTVTQFAYPDGVSALHGLFVVLAALDYRTRSGRGQFIDVSQYEATVSSMGQPMLDFLANGEEPRPMGNRASAAAPHGCFRCAGDDAWCAISVGGEEEWRSLCRVAGRPDWAADERFASLSERIENQEALDQELTR